VGKSLGYTNFARHSDYQAQLWKPAKSASAAPSSSQRACGASSIAEGGLVVAEERPEGILIRPAVALPVEIYTPERKAELLLANAVDAKDYQAALAEVRKLGVDRSKISRRKPRKSGA